MKIALAGTGAFGIKHLDGLANIDGVTVTSVVSRRLEQAEEVARKYGVGHAGTDLDEALARDDVDAVILCTPTQLHAAQSIAAMRAGKHVQVEIPVADSWADAQEVQRVQQETGLTCMVGHTRRFNPSHQWVRHRITAGELSIQQMDVQTYFFRRTNMNAAGQPRSWTDHLLWHHAAHTVDLFQYQTGEQAAIANAVQGPVHPDLGIAMDMSVQLRTPSRADLHAVAQLQQRRPARHLLPLHLRQRHLHRPLRRPGDRPRGALDVSPSTSPPTASSCRTGSSSRRSARAASPTPASPASCPATACSANWRPSSQASGNPARLTRPGYSAPPRPAPAPRSACSPIVLAASASLMVSASSRPRNATPAPAR